ncbi:MAG: DoxX family protein [Chloroflexota bacterium]
MSSRWRKTSVVLGPSIFLGLTLLAAGSGKLPGRLEFIDALLRSLWTPGLAYFIGYCLPWIEIVLGVLLLTGVFARIAAGLCLPLTAGFMANNSWALSQGMEQFPQCDYCFGIWEKLFGTISPLQALSLDILLFCLAFMILLLHPAGFSSSRPWFIKQRGEGLI